MYLREKSLKQFLGRSFARFRDVPTEEVEAACDRVLERLRDEGAGIGFKRPNSPKPPIQSRIALAAAAAAIVATVFLSNAVFRNPVWRRAAPAVAVVIDGILIRVPGSGQSIRHG